MLTLGQTRFNLGLTTHFVLHIVTNYKERKDSPATGREEGVENQSPDRLLMTTQETELTMSIASDLENTAETTLVCGLPKECWQFKRAEDPPR